MHGERDDDASSDLTTGSVRVRRCCLGYDVRYGLDRLPALWPAERRVRYLLLQSVAAPLSIDRTVWPSVFLDVDAPRGGILQNELRCDAYDESSRINGFWTDPEPMLAKITGSAALARDHWIIAGELITEEAIADEASVAFRNSLQRSSSILLDSSSWLSLGYDIIDRNFTSHLTGTSYLTEFQDRLRIDFESRLNSTHLFSKWQYAEAFRKHAAKLLGIAASLYVCAIYRLPPQRLSNI